MLRLLGDLLPYAVPVALSPLPIIAVVMLLLAPAGGRGGFGFLAGRLLTLAGLAFLISRLTGLLAGPGPSERSAWLQLGLGALLVVAAGLAWRSRPRGDATPALPGWMRSIQTASPVRAVGLGALLTVLNPKEAAFVLGAGLIIGAAGVPAPPALVAAAVFALLAGSGAAAPVIWSLRAGDDGRARLGAARDWLVRNNAIVAAAVLLIIGAMLIGDGLAGL